MALPHGSQFSHGNTGAGRSSDHWLALSEPQEPWNCVRQARRVRQMMYLFPILTDWQVLWLARFLFTGQSP